MGKKNKNKTKYNETSLAVANTDKSEVKETKADNKTENKSAAKTYSYSSYYSKPNFDKKGKLNETKFPEFIKLCKLEQMALKDILIDELLASGYEVNYGDGYLYAKGNIPVLLTSHMDTVHKTPVIDFYEYYDEEKKRHIVSSPQGIGGDDRCGIYIILEIIKTHKCSVLFCEDEEIGGVGSRKFCKSKLIDDLSKLNYLIELDRANGTDAVFYDCENDEFTEFITKNTGYKTAWGSFSDISNLAPECGVAAVNLSCGYYNAHTTSEYVVIEEMMNTIEVVKKLLDVECEEQFEYIEFNYGYGNYGYGYGGYYGGYYGSYGKGYGRSYYDDDDDFYDSYYKHQLKNKNTNNKKEEEKVRSLVIMFACDSFEETLMYVSNGKSVEEAFGKFFIDNPSYCFDDVADYEFYESKVYEDGWYSTTRL